MRCAAGVKSLSPKKKKKNNNNNNNNNNNKNEQRVASGISGRVLLGAQDFRILAFLSLQQVLVEVQAL